MATTAFGRVDSENNVFVVEAGVERRVGQYPNVSAEEALAFYERKFADLEVQVRNLEQRVAAKADASSIKKNLQTITSELVEPAAVGDLAGLRARVAAIDAKIGALVAEKTEANKEQIAEGLAARTKIAEAAEALANQDAAKTQWKNSSAQMTALFEQWQQLQKSGPKVPKGEADAIWKRFSTARTKFDAAKRQYFASLDAANKATKAKKAGIVAAAEALVAKGSDAVVEYRKLLDDWKASGRSVSKADDELWARFKAAGDAIYAAKSAAVEVENTEYAANLAVKLELLKEAEKTVTPEKDLSEAKKALLAIQQRWEKAGKVPREKVREVEDRLKAVEAKVRKVEEDHWRKTDPAAIDRTNSVLTQLEDSIAKLEAELKEAKAKKDAKATKAASDALEARQAWLKVVKAASN
ncbi:MAG: DUF349 domain-containing protein [Micrococcales bacterium]